MDTVFQVSENTYLVLPSGYCFVFGIRIVLQSLLVVFPYLMYLYLRQYDLTCLHKARELLIKDFQKKHSIPELASQVGINEYKLKHGFKQIFGMPVMTYLRTERLKQAKTLLEETNLTEAGISKKVGFKSASSFINAFKKEFGVLPHTLRKS